MEREDIVGDLVHYPIRYDPRYDDEFIFRYIRSLSCDICHTPPPSTVSHTVKKGRSGNNASAIWTMPLCMCCHTDYETMKLAEFETKYRVDMRLKCVLAMERTFRYLIDLLQQNAP